MWPCHLQWTEDKDRAGTLAWGECDNSPTSLGGILTQSPEILGLSQQQLVVARDGRGVGAATRTRGKATAPLQGLGGVPKPHCGLPQLREEDLEPLSSSRASGLHCLMEIKMLLIRVAVAERGTPFSKHLLQPNNSAQSCLGGKAPGMDLSGNDSTGMPRAFACAVPAA